MLKKFFLNIPVGNDIPCTVEAVKLYLKTGKHIYKETVKNCFGYCEWNIPHINKKYNSYLNALVKELRNPEHVIEIKLKGNNEQWYTIISNNSTRIVGVE